MKGHNLAEKFELGKEDCAGNMLDIFRPALPRRVPSPLLGMLCS